MCVRFQEIQLTNVEWESADDVRVCAVRADDLSTDGSSLPQQKCLARWDRSVIIHHRFCSATPDMESEPDDRGFATIEGRTTHLSQRAILLFRGVSDHTSTHKAAIDRSSPTYLLSKGQGLDCPNLLHGAAACDVDVRTASEGDVGLLAAQLGARLWEAGQCLDTVGCLEESAWANCHEEISWCVRQFERDTEVATLLCAARITTVIESTLRQVFSVAADSALVPPLLKDILQSDSAASLFGGPAILLLRVLLGPPDGYNIRNLLWHGFLQPGELPRALTAVLLRILPTLGPAVKRLGIVVLRRAPSFDCEDRMRVLMSRSNLAALRPTDVPLEVVVRRISQEPFFATTNARLWAEVETALSQVARDTFPVFFVLFTQLEVAMRHVSGAARRLQDA